MRNAPESRWGDKVNPYFSQDDTLYAAWKTEALKDCFAVLKAS